MREEKRGKRDPVWRSAHVWLLMAAVLTVSWILAYTLVTGQIIDTSIRSIEELARHDEQAIVANLRNKWDILSGIGRSLEQRRCGTTDELLAELNASSQLIDCPRLTLVSMEGGTATSDFLAEENRALRDLCRTYGGQFICRCDAETADAEELMAGVALSRPLTVEGVAYTYLVARLDAKMFENELKIDSYGGRGYSSLIGIDGSYIVNIERSGAPRKADNFFTFLTDGTLPGDYPVERVRSLVREKQPFSLRFTRGSGEAYIIVFAPMREMDWSFVTVVPRAVFEEQSMSLIRIFTEVMAVVLLVVAAAAGMAIRRRTRQAALERKHREEMARALAMAEQASRAKTVFLNSMSHDIRTPMNAIIGFAALASVHIDNRERVKDYLGKITQSSGHLLSLINDVLDMSRIEAGKMILEDRPENLSEILHGVRDIIQSDIHAKHQELLIDTVDVFDEDILCDKLRLNQVLLNILSNAVKFTPAGGTISMRITERPAPGAGYASYEFRIKDSGIGMSPDFVKTIFEPFSQERSSSVSGVQGTGLGMSITKSIVDMMGGTIQVNSEEGVGSEFVVTVEFKLQGGPRAAETVEALEGLRGLVADGDTNACRSTARMLRRLGMRPEWTARGREAVARAEEAQSLGEPFRVYILDRQLPDMSGVEAARSIRRAAGEQALIFILTACDWTEAEAEVRQAGVTGVIGKPLFLSDLRRALLRSRGEAREEAPGGPEPDAAFSGKRLLLVDDNPLNQEIAQEILKEAGFLVETAENGQQAVEAVRKARPDWFQAVLMDVQMPLMDGYEATRAIRALDDPARSRVPIIAMTANAFEEDKRAAREAGMDDHVGKPIDVPALLEILRRFMRDDHQRS